MGTAARHDADEHADSPGTAPRKRRLKPLVIGIAIVVVVALVATAAVLIVAKGFTEQEKQVRSDWTVETGDMLKRIDGLGRVVRTYPLGGYELHHDINYGPDNTVVALTEAPGRTTVEDLVIEVDLETGAVTELVDFSELMADYKDAYTHVIGATDTFFWQAGEWDWIHLNTVEYLPGEDSLIVSSRETSAIIKVTDVHGEPAVSYLIVDENAGTYELIASFAVPYSSIVSNVAHAPAGTNYVVNSGIDNTFGEYDESGELIREFSYTCTLQGYRVFKHDFAGFWFAG